MNRFELVAAQLEARGLEALLVFATSAHAAEISPFVGPSSVHRCLLVVPRRGTARFGYFTPMEREEAAASGVPLLTPEELDAERWTREGAPDHALLAGVLGEALRRSEIGPGAVAIAGRWPVGVALEAGRRLGADGWTLVPGESLVGLARRAKAAWEIDAARAAMAGSEEAFRRVAALLAAAETRDGTLWIGAERLRTRRLRAEVATVLARHGLEQPEGNIIAAGAEGAVPHTTGDDDRVLRHGETLVVDLFPRGTVYSDATRTFCVGPPAEAVRRAHDLVVSALEAAEKAARAGAVGWDLQVLVCDRFQEAGFPTPISDPGTVTGYVHGLGHGVGHELHELPAFRLRSVADEGVLAEGDLVTIEPGLYDPSAGWGIRVEDLYLVREEGVENLTSLPRELDPRAYGPD